jgi:hypothetical protein
MWNWRRTAVIVITLALIVLLGSTLGKGSIFAADLSLLPRHSESRSPDASAKTESRLEDFAKGPNAACTAWTDGCRSCGSGPDGVFCSNVGIACQPSKPRCSRP